jgi:asparagine synthase (glutamine-hydrolysing)
LPIDEPVGVLLSGGIDSSLVTALLVKAGLQVRAYALDFGVESYSELPYAQQVADFLQIPLIRVAATGDAILRAIGPTAKALDIPYGDGTTAALFLLKQAAAQDVRVVFNGENGDQLFAGWTNKPLIANGVYSAEHPAGKETFEQQYLRTFQRFYGYEKLIFSPEMLDRIQAHDLSVYLQDAIGVGCLSKRCPSLLARLRRASLMLKGAQNIQPRATALGFACGLWVRSPFCDPDLTDWTFQLPGELLLQGACEKYILKKAAERWLPPEIVWREKRGMGVPLKVWYYREFWGAIGDRLNPNVLRSENCWQPHLADAMLSGQLGVAMRDRYIGNNLWLLLMWQAWRTEVLGEIPVKRSLDHVFWLPPEIGQRIWKYRRRLE